MSKKTYTAATVLRTPLPRSKRLRELGLGGVTANSTTVVSVMGESVTTGDGHTHSNKADIDKVVTDSERYIYLKELEETEDGYEYVDEKAKVGYADVAGHAEKAGHADMAHDLDEDSPVYDKVLSSVADDEAAGHLTLHKGATVENGLVIRTPKTIRELRAQISPDLLEDSSTVGMSLNILEDIPDGINVMSVNLLEESSGGGGASTVGEMDNTDETFDTVPDGIYSWQKKAGVYYPIKGGVGSSSKMALAFVSSSTPVVVYGKDFTIRYSFSSVMDDEPTGPGTVTYMLNNKVVASANIEQGTVSFDVGKRLYLGDNTLVVQVTDAYGNTRKLTYAINAVSISISSTFDDTRAYTGAVTFPYTPIGAISKTIHFKVDGTEAGTVDTAVSNRQQTYTIPAKAHGAHLLEVYITATVDGTDIESEHLYYDIICKTDGNNTPIIASAFQAKEISQFDTVGIPFIVYSPSSSTSSVSLKVNGTVVSTQTVDRTRQLWSYRANSEGKLTLSITCGSTSKTFPLTVNKSTINVEAETQDLELYLTSQNRSNSDTNRTEWKHGSIAATLTGFNWKTNGWMKDDKGYSCLRVTPGSRVTIPLNLFGKDFRSTGKTIEIDFLMRSVYNYDTPVISCWSGGRGVQITSQSAALKSEQSGIDTKFRDEERVRLAFVVEKRSENRLLSIYVNGIKSGSHQYPDADNFMQAAPVGISIGCDDSTVDVYNIRVYSNNLNRYQLLDNYIADMDDITEKIALYVRNQIYDDYGSVSFVKVNSMIDCLVLEGDLPQYKGDKKTNKIYLYSASNPALNWVADIKNNVQGTSSQYYPRKNYKLEFIDGLTYLESGKKEAMYQVTEDVLPAKVFCIKTDFAESSGTHNTGVANMVDWMLKELGFLTTPQKSNPKVRTTVAGRPCVLFHKPTPDSEPEFIGKVNLNTDKAAENTFGFSAGDESIEFLNNTSDIALFKTANLTDWSDTLEFRYPDGGEDITNAQKVFTWIVSCKGNPTKFKAELSQYFDKNQLLYYALMTLCLGMVDQRAKNMFLSHIGSKLWMFLFYDNDTILPINNEAVIAFLYNVEIQDTIGNQNVWNGADSELWKLVDDAFADDIRQLYYTMRQKNVLSYDRMMEYLYTRQADKWCEALYNEDGFYKYEQPLIEGYLDYSQSHENPQVVKTGAYLYALQGSREMYGKWIWKNRLLYLDSKFLAGSILADTAVFRTYTPTVWTGVKPCADITLTAFNAMYFNVKWGSVTKSQRVGFNETVKMPAPTGMQFNDTETIVYGASLISSLGDLSPLYVGSVDVSKMTRLKELIIGSTVAGYSNANFTVLSIGTNTLLAKLNIANCPKFAAPVDLSGCDNIREIYAQGTAATTVLLPEAGILETMHLPETITSLTVMNQINLTAVGLILDGVQNLSTIRWENTNGINVLTIIDRCLALSTIKLDRIRLIGVDWFLSTLDMVVKLSKLKGLDEHGNNTDKAVVTGKCYAAVATQVHVDKIKAAFPELVVTYGQLKPTPVTTFTFSSSASKTLTNVVFTCDVEYDKVNDYTYKVAVEDGTTVNITFKADNHELISQTYVTAGTRTQSYSVPYIPLRTIRVKVYNQSTYVPGANVTVNGKGYIADANGYIYHRGGEAVTGEVTAYGYGSNTFSYGAITYDISHTVEVYAAVDVKFVVKYESTLIDGATVKCGSQTGQTNQYGEVVLPIAKGSYEYTVSHSDYLTKTGSVTVGTSTVIVNVVVELNIEKLKPVENGNIQMLLKGVSASITIASSIAEYIIDWGDGTTSSATGTGSVKYAHTYVSDGFYQVEVQNHTGITSCISFNVCLLAYWSIGDSQVKNLNFANFYNLIYLGNVFKNDSNRTDCTHMMQSCYKLTNVDLAPLASWVKVTNCADMLNNCQRLTSIDLTPLASWVNVTNCNNMLYGCSGLTSIDLTPLTSWVNVINCYSLLYGCNGLTSIDLTPLASWEKVTGCGSLLGRCRGLTNIDLTPLASWVNVINCYSLLNGCRGLTNVDLTPLASWVNVINCYSLLDSCSGLTNVDLTPLASWVNVTNCSNLLNDCSKLTYISILSVTPFTLSSGALTNGNTCPIYVPDSAVNTYKTATNWSAYASRIKPISEKP